MAGNVSMTLSESLNSSLLSNSDWQYQLEDLPNELLTLILGYLPLPDLANIRSVCSRLQKLVDDSACKHLWGNASLEGSCLWLTKKNKRLIHRAADNGNVEAIIMLGVAYLYSEGVPEGSGKGTYNAYNGIKATEYLVRAESLIPMSPPFSWALFRPPWAPDTMCCKACVCQRMKEHCSRNTTISPTGIHYCIGKALSFHDNTTESDDAKHWYELGSEAGCLCSRLELWRSTYKQQLLRESFEPLRQLRAIVSQSGPSSLLEAQLELCSAYARGFYGGKSRMEALGFVREVVQRARPLQWESIFKLRENISQNVRYILMDWVIEVAGLKHFSPQTVHLAVSLMDRFLRLRPVPRSNLQLLGITALLLAARWSSEFILTVREAAWLTESTYKYDEVVRMMGRLVATFKGEVKKEAVVTDYMDVMLDLVRANTHTRNMAYYLSECLLLHAKFGRYSASHLAAACVLDARVLLGTEFPWPQSLVEATGLSVSDLRACCLALYDECLTDKNTIMDHREVKLESVATRYNNKMFGNISEQKLMSYSELKEQLGVDPDTSFALFTPTPKPHRHANRSDKLLSFLSDSCYLTPGTKQPSTLSDSEPDSDLDSNMADQLELSSASSSPSPLDLSASEIDRIPPPFSPSQCSSKSLAHSASGSGFPQPLFDDDDLTLSSPPRSAPRSRQTVSTSHGASNVVDLDTEDTLFAQSRGPLASNVSLNIPALPFPLVGHSPNPAPSSSGCSQGSEETPIEYDSLSSRHPAPAEQQLLASVSNSLKMLPFKARQAPSERVALKSVENVPSPSLGGRMRSSENSSLSKGSLVAKKKQSKRKARVL